METFVKKREKSDKIRNVEAIIYTDASTTDWGAVRDDQKIHGFLDQELRKRHINYLELLTVEIALNKLAVNMKNCQILLRIDNTTAIAYVNKMGGVRYLKYHYLARRIWKWAEERNIFLFAAYIASKENVEADRLSRLKNEDGEWELAPFAFKRIVESLDKPEIDLFATRLNKKCKKFVSWFLESDAIEIDAFTCSWANLDFYTFPPFSQILKTLVKIKKEKACGIVVVPNWPNQSWYPLFMKLLISRPIVFKPEPNLLLLPCRSIRHPRAKHLSLIVGRLSARPSRGKGCLENRWT